MPEAAPSYYHGLGEEAKLNVRLTDLVGDHTAWICWHNIDVDSGIRKVDLECDHLVGYRLCGAPKGPKARLPPNPALVCYL